MNKKLCIVLILVLSSFVHFLYFGHPNEVVFDEVWYGRHVNDYINGTFHFDGHPPLGRMTVAGFVKIFNYNPSSSFANIGEKFTDKQYIVLRFLPSLAGAILPVIIFLIMQELGIGPLVSLAGSIMVIFDNGLLIQSRLLLMDSFLLLYGFTSLLFYFRYRNRGGKFNLFMTGIFASFAFSVKWVGLSFIGLPIIVEGLVMLGQIVNVSLGSISWRRFLLTFSALVVVPFIIYFCIITAYSSLLYKSGTGDAFMSPEYQKTLQGNSYENNPDIKPSNVFQKFYELNVQMYKVNQGLTANHPYSSLWYSWPFIKRPVYYWVNSNSRIYFIGNPIVWWVSTIAIAYAILFAVNNLWRKLRNTSLQISTASKTVYVLLAGYVLNLLPYVGIKRIMFLYHYLSALIFAIIIFAYLLDKRFGKTEYNKKHFKIIMGILILLTIEMFVYFAPLSYGLPLSPKSYESRVWFPGWK